MHGWSLGETGEGTKVRLEVGLNSRRKVSSLTDSKLLIQGMQGITGLPKFRGCVCWVHCVDTADLVDRTQTASRRC